MIRYLAERFLMFMFFLCPGFYGRIDDTIIEKEYIIHHRDIERRGVNNRRGKGRRRLVRRGESQCGDRRDQDAG